jgi:DNA polymerase
MSADILIVGDAPGASDDLLGVPFVGSAGQLIDSMIAEIEDFPSTYFTTAILCHPKDEKGEQREPAGVEFKTCSRWTARIFAGVNPKAVIFLGKLAAKHCRAFVPANGKIFSMMHPAYVMRNGGKSSPLFQHNVRVLEDVAQYVRQN